MIKKIIESRATKNPITGFKKSESNNIYLANKVLTLNSNDTEKTKFYIGKKKDLLYKLPDGTLVALSDYAYLNKIFVDCNLFKEFCYEEYRLFLKTYGISTHVKELDMEEIQEDDIYAINLEKLVDFDYNTRGKDIDDYISFIERVNRFNSPFIRRNFKSPTINPSTVKPDVVIANRNDIEDYLERLQYDTTTNQSLSKMYSRKLFK